MSAELRKAGASDDGARVLVDSRPCSNTAIDLGYDILSCTIVCYTTILYCILYYTILYYTILYYVLTLRPLVLRPSLRTSELPLRRLRTDNTRPEKKKKKEKKNCGKPSFQRTNLAKSSASAAALQGKKTHELDSLFCLDCRKNGHGHIQYPTSGWARVTDLLVQRGQP